MKKRLPDITGFFSGTSGLQLPVTKKDYPPAFQGKTGLMYYASLFSSIEINSSFYKLPRAQTVMKWAQAVPGSFRFSFKLSQSVSHAKALQFSEKEISDFFSVVNEVNHKKGCILIQFPASTTVLQTDQLEKLLQSIRQYDPSKNWDLAIEFRHASWYDTAVYDLLNVFEVALVQHDFIGVAAPFIEQHNKHLYFRFHGPEKGYRGNYSDAFLKNTAKQIQTGLSKEKEIYCYFNNTLGAALKNLQLLNDLVGFKMPVSLGE